MSEGANVRLPNIHRLIYREFVSRNYIEISHVTVPISQNVFMVIKKENTKKKASGVGEYLASLDYMYSSS